MPIDFGDFCISIDEQDKSVLKVYCKDYEYSLKNAGERWVCVRLEKENASKLCKALTNFLSN